MNNNLLPALTRRFSVPSVFTIFDDLDFPRWDVPFTSDLEAWENESSIGLSVELPGYEKNQISITREGDSLNITAQKEETKEGKDRRYITRSRLSSQFSKTLTLPSGLKDEIEATYNNGVLTITIPKVEEKKPKRIEVK